MQIACPQCSAQYNVDEARIPPQGVSIKCPRCQNQFVVHSRGAAEPAVALPGMGGASVPLPGAGPSAVPLPGMGGMGAVPLPGGGGAVPLPGMGGMGAVPLPGGGGAVPLPGMGGMGAVPLPGGGGAVPLPGGGGAVPLPGGGGAVPLPGGGAMPSMEDIFGSSGPQAAAPPTDLGGGMAGNRSLSMNDIFGDVGGPSGEGAPVPAHPFHGTNSVMVNAQAQGGDVLDFIDGAGRADAMPRNEQFSIRKRSGRVLGPFDVQAVLAMFHKGELLGSEEASADGVTWRPLAQIPAFSQTIQKAMASALAGLDDLPMPKGSGMEDLPAPRDSNADLPGLLDDLPAPKRNKALAAAQDAFPELGTEALREAEKAKSDVEKKRRARNEGGKGTTILAAGVSAAILIALGVAVHFVTPYGAFGYKLVFPDPVVVAPPKPAPVIEAPPPPVNANQPDQDFGDLIKQDTYAAYRQGADQAGRSVEAGKAMTPFPESAKKAAAQQARFLSYLVVVEELPAFVGPLKSVAPLAGGDDVSKAIAEAALSYAEKQWDKGIATLGPYKDPARGLDPVTRSEVLVWSGLGLSGKGDDAGAVRDWDEALTASTKSPLALYLQAKNLSESGAPDAALEYCDKVLALNPNHARAGILKGRLLAQQPDKLEEGKALLIELSDGKKGEAGSPAQRALAYMGRSEIAVTERQQTESIRFLQKAIELVPQNRQVRVQVADAALRQHDYNVAREHGKKLLELDPDDIDGVVLTARAAMGARDPLAAYTELQAVSRKAPDNAAVAYWFGVAAREMSKPDEARAQFEKAAKLDPKRADPVVDLITELIEQGKIDDALKRGTEAEKTISPGERYKVRNAKAYALIRRRNFVEAEKELKAALEEAPRDTSVRARYVTMLVAQGRLEDAEKALDAAVQLDAKGTSVLIAAGDVALARGNAKGAMSKYEEAMQMSPNLYQPYLHAAVAAIELKDQQRAKGFVDTAGQLRATATDVIATQGLVMKAVDPKQAARTLQQAIDQSPNEPGLSYLLGQLHASMSAPLEALDALRRAVELDPSYTDAQYLLGKVSRDIGRNTDAKAALEKAVELDPMRVQAWTELADILAQQDKGPEALRAYERAINADPKNPQTTCAFGETLVQRMGDEMKNLKRGAEMLERCVKLNDKHPTAWKILGNAYRSLNKRKDAARAYKTHLEVSPADEENELVRDFVKELGG